MASAARSRAPIVGKSFGSAPTRHTTTPAHLKKTMPETEFLNADELGEVTGYKHIASQKEWLDKKGWAYVTNAAGRPVVSRWYARMRMAGITPTANGIQPAAWKPDFSALS